MKTPINFKSLNEVCKQNTFRNVKRDNRARENTAIIRDCHVSLKRQCHGDLVLFQKSKKGFWATETANLWSSFVINTTPVYQNTKLLISVSNSQLIGSQGIALEKYKPNPFH